MHREIDSQGANKPLQAFARPWLHILSGSQQRQKATSQPCTLMPQSSARQTSSCRRLPRPSPLREPPRGEYCHGLRQWQTYRSKIPVLRCLPPEQRPVGLERNTQMRVEDQDTGSSSKLCPRKPKDTLEAVSLRRCSLRGFPDLDRD
jgi:hypothetical protein